MHKPSFVKLKEAFTDAQYDIFNLTDVTLDNKLKHRQEIFDNLEKDYNDIIVILNDSLSKNKEMIDKGYGYRLRMKRFVAYRYSSIIKGNVEYMYTCFICILYYYDYHTKNGYTFGYDALQLVKNERKWWQFWKPKYRALDSYGYRTNVYNINEDT